MITATGHSRAATQPSCAPAGSSAVTLALASKLAALLAVGRSCNLCASGVLKVGARRIQAKSRHKTTNCSDQIVCPSPAPFVDVIWNHDHLSRVPAPLGASTVIVCFVSEMLHYAYMITKTVLAQQQRPKRNFEREREAQ